MNRVGALTGWILISPFLLLNIIFYLPFNKVCAIMVLLVDGGPHGTVTVASGLNYNDVLIQLPIRLKGAFT